MCLSGDPLSARIDVGREKCMLLSGFLIVEQIQPKGASPPTGRNFQLVSAWLARWFARAWRFLACVCLLGETCGLLRFSAHLLAQAAGYSASQRWEPLYVNSLGVVAGSQYLCASDGKALSAVAWCAICFLSVDLNLDFAGAWCFLHGAL